jgi:hypothetical protein
VRRAAEAITDIAAKISVVWLESSRWGISRAFKAAPVATPICKNRDFTEISRPVVSKS